MRKYGQDFAADAALNKLALADEAEIQPTLMDHYGQLLAEAKSEKDRLQMQSKLTRAEISLNFRRFPPSDLKITEAVIEALVEADATVQAKEEELLKARELVYTYEAAMAAIGDKSSMIKVLQALWQQGYYTAS